MARFSELIEVHLKETEAIIAQSALLLQKKTDGQSGELKSAGNLVEIYVRNFINRISPDGINGNWCQGNWCQSLNCELKLDN